MSSFLLNPYIMQPIETYNYGDGSLNTVINGYNGILKVNGEIKWNTPVTYSYGNCSGWYYKETGPTPTPSNGELFDYLGTPTSVFMQNSIINNASTKRGYILSGTNNYMTINPVNGDQTIAIAISGGGLTGSAYQNGFKIWINNTLYTLKESVDNGYIKPIVAIFSESWSTSYVWENYLNTYTGQQTSTKSYPIVGIVFMMNNGYTFTGFQMYSNVAYSTTYDGYAIFNTDINNFRMTI